MRVTWLLLLCLLATPLVSGSTQTNDDKSSPPSNQNLATRAAEAINEAIFRTNPDVAKFLNEKDSNLINSRSRKEQTAIKDYLASKKFDTVAVHISPDGKKVTVAMNVKERKYNEQGKADYGVYGYVADLHRAAMKEALLKISELKGATVTVVGPKKQAKTKEKNAAPHAEGQLLAFKKIDMTKGQLGVSKEPCENCAKQLKEKNVKSHAAGGKSLPSSRVKNWKHPAKLKIRVKDRFSLSDSDDSDTKKHKTTKESRGNRHEGSSHRQDSSKSTGTGQESSSDTTSTSGGSKSSNSHHSHDHGHYKKHGHGHGHGSKKEKKH